ncbi:hypothetical protein [Streptomyces sp. NPDC048606]|uniref:hypothetical protein n=1 Tax=Streptomyces sp. NPDC048606 TaxID=3154726 RepID=UPI0034173213
MRVSRALATATLTLAALGIAGTASIASATPATTPRVPSVSTDATGGPGGKPEIRAAATSYGGHQVLAFAQDGRDHFHP